MMKSKYSKEEQAFMRLMYKMGRIREESGQKETTHNMANEIHNRAIVARALKALEILKQNIILVKLNDGTEFFDLDLWNSTKQKEDFEFVKDVLNLDEKNTVEQEVIELKEDNDDEVC